MKLFITADGDSIRDKVDISFGRCSYYFVFNTDDESYEFIENEHQDAQTSVGAAVAQSAVDLNVDAVISTNPGPRAFKILKEAKIDVYHIDLGTNLKKVISAFDRNDLVPIEVHIPFQGKAK